MFRLLGTKIVISIVKIKNLIHEILIILKTQLNVYCTNRDSSLRDFYTKTLYNNLLKIQFSDQSKKHCIMCPNNTFLHTDILAMNVSWLEEDLELIENQYNIFESMVFTISLYITFVLAIIVHRAFYKLMKRLPGRDINQIVFPYMVKLEAPKTLLE